MWHDPGPFAVRDDPPDEAPVSSRASFARALDVALPHLDAGDEQLASAHRVIGTVTDEGLDGLFMRTVGQADTTVDAEHNAPNDTTAYVLTYSGNAVDSLHDGAQPYLPPAEMPIRSDFVEPPPPDATPTPTTPAAPDVQQQGGTIDARQ